MNRRTFLTAGMAVVATAAVSYFVWPGATPVNAGQVFTGTTPGIAINGYDAVAYFKQGKPVEGAPDISHTWNGVKWQFSSAENKDLFAANPEQYAPQYGGFCAYALAKGSKAKTEPDSFTVVDNKLYLNYDKNVQSLWEQDKVSYIKSADENWPGLSQ